MKISCICVTYGRHQYLNEVIQCFLDQRHEDKELVILNTCPRQKFIYEHPLIKVVNLDERPKSHCDSMHQGVLHSTGEWCVPFDDDDIFLPGFLSQYAFYIEQHPSYHWLQLRGRYTGSVSSVETYDQNGTFCHLFAYSRVGYDKVGGYIAPGKLYNADVCDQNLFGALSNLSGSDVFNNNYDSSMVYRWGGISYHHSSQNESNECSKYQHVGVKVNAMLDSGELLSGDIYLNPVSKYDWQSMCSIAFDVHHAKLIAEMIPKPTDILDSIRNTTWAQYINPAQSPTKITGGQFVCNKTFDNDCTRDGHKVSVDGDVITYDGHRLSYDDHGQLVGRHDGFKVNLRYEKINFNAKPIMDKRPAKKINLFVQTYKSSNAARQAELDFCLKTNKSNHLIKVFEIERDARITFGEMIDYASQYTDDGTITILTNSDIVFDETIAYAFDMSSEQCYWLSRYDPPYATMDFSRYSLNMNPESSDAWVFRGEIKDIDGIDFGLGIWGCDGAFANRLTSAGYQVVNPSKSIKIYHVHESKHRTNQYPEAPKPWGKVDQCALPWKCAVPERPLPIVVLASLPRSGTSSMCQMMETIGFKTAHTCFNFPEALRDGYNFFSDTPFYNVEYLLCILQHHKDVKVIYIDRDVDQVVDSWERTNLINFKKDSDYSKLEDTISIVDASCWDNLRSDTSIHKHKSKVLSLCRTMGVDCLVYNFSDGWGPLCKFVGRSVINTVEVPHLKNDFKIL